MILVLCITFHIYIIIVCDRSLFSMLSVVGPAVMTLSALTHRRSLSRLSHYYHGDIYRNISPLTLSSSRVPRVPLQTPLLIVINVRVIVSFTAASISISLHTSPIHLQYVLQYLPHLIYIICSWMTSYCHGTESFGVSVSITAKKYDASNTQISFPTVLRRLWEEAGGTVVKMGVVSHQHLCHTLGSTSSKMRFMVHTAAHFLSRYHSHSPIFYLTLSKTIASLPILAFQHTPSSLLTPASPLLHHLSLLSRYSYSLPRFPLYYVSFN